jgi:predicted DNA-binding transcriptional regulator AlpA
MPDFVRVADIVSNKKTGRVGMLSIGKSLWWQGVREGRFPAPIKLSSRVTLWRRTDIEALLSNPVETKGSGK